MPNDKPTTDAETLARTLVDVCETNKAKDIQLYSTGEATLLADFFLICSATSEPHLRALSDHLGKDLADQDITPLHTDGSPAGRWIVVDFGTVLVHILHPEVRSYYQLEKLWEEGELIYSSSTDDEESVPVF